MSKIYILLFYASIILLSFNGFSQPSYTSGGQHGAVTAGGYVGVSGTGGTGTGLTATLLFSSASGQLSASFAGYAAQSVNTVSDFDPFGPTTVTPSGGTNSGNGATFQLTFAPLYGAVTY